MYKPRSNDDSTDEKEFEAYQTEINGNPAFGITVAEDTTTEWIECTKVAEIRL